MKKITTVVHIYAPNGLSGYITFKDRFTAFQFRMYHFFNRTGYTTEIVKE